MNVWNRALRSIATHRATSGHTISGQSGTSSCTGTGSGSSGIVATKLARITITTDPPGADVFDSQDRKLGVTPMEIGLPADGAEHELTFRHPRRKERKKMIVASGDATVTVVLERR